MSSIESELSSNEAAGNNGSEIMIETNSYLVTQPELNDLIRDLHLSK